MSLNTVVILLKMLKAGARDPRRLPHLARTLRSFRRTRTRLLQGKNGQRRTMLIALVEHMGDIVAAEPLARQARRQYPDARIGWVLRQPYAELAAGFTALDDVVVVTCLTEWQLLSSLGLADVTWDLHLSDRQCLACGFAFRRPGPSMKFTHKNYYDFGSLLKVDCLVAGLPPIDDAPRLEPPPAAVAAVDALALPPAFVAIHCKSNEDRRDWTRVKWLELVAWINETAGLPVCEIGTSASVAGAGNPSLRNLCGSLSLLETVEVLRRAALFIGIDSGPAHLAHAAATPGIILLGRYADFAVYTPYSGGYGDGTLADLVRSEGPASDIPVETVINRVGARLAAARKAVPIPTANPN